MSRGVNMDLSSSALSDEREFEGEFVWTPKSRCYKGVVVIDGNSLYGSIITKIGIFINRYTSVSPRSGLAQKLGHEIDHVVERLQVDDVV